MGKSEGLVAGASADDSGIFRRNERKIVAADLEQAGTPTTADGRDHPRLKRDKGYIALCGHGSCVELRNMYVRELK